MSPKPSQLPAQGREINGYSHSTFCVCGLIHGGRGQQIYTWWCIFVVPVTSRDNVQITNVLIALILLLRPIVAPLQWNA